MIRVVTVDRCPVFRAGVRAVLAPVADLVVVGEAGTAHGARAVVARTGPRVALLDPRLCPGRPRAGWELCRALTDAHDGLAVLVLAEGGTARTTASAAGARGCLAKGGPIADLLRVIRLLGGGGVLTAAPVHARPPRADPPLTPREVAVLDQIAHGRTNRLIGERLHISEDTVKFHVRNLLRKLGSDRRSGAVLAAARAGVL